MNDKITTGRARYCAICGRKLKTARSVGRGIGPKCLKKKITSADEPRQTLLFEDSEEIES